MKQLASKNRTKREREFSYSDQVFLKLKPYKKGRVAMRKNFKLNPGYYRPYQISRKKIWAVANLLKLPERSCGVLQITGNKWRKDGSSSCHSAGQETDEEKEQSSNSWLDSVGSNLEHSCHSRGEHCYNLQGKNKS